MTAPPITSVAVGVPAHDEAGHIAACIRSIDIAAGRVELPVHLTVVDDASADGTAQEAAQALLDSVHLTGTLITSRCGTVGAARATALDHALRSGPDPTATWLATTDADTTVGPTWLVGQLAWAARGVGAVAGLVNVDWDPASEHLAAGYSASLGDVSTGHTHVHGANLGLHGAYWLAVGGCGDGSDGEDHELWRRLTAAGVSVLGVDDLPVRTSGRLIGRVPLGFSGYLRALAAPSAPADLQGLAPPFDQAVRAPDVHGPRPHGDLDWCRSIEGEPEGRTRSGLDEPARLAWSRGEDLGWKRLLDA